MKLNLRRLAAGLAALCCLAGAPGRAATPSGGSLDSSWEAAVTAFQKGDAREAARLFSSWREEAERQGVRSPEASYDLGLAEWAMKDPGAASFHVAESARLRSSPLGMSRVLGTLAEMERELGVQDPVSESLSFRLHYLLNRDWIAAMTAIAFWCLAGAGLLRWLKGAGAGSAPGALIALAVALLFATGLGTANRRVFGRYGIIVGEAGVPLYRDPDKAEAKKLADLPAGMVVAFGRTEGDVVEKLFRPVSGWVPESALKRLEAGR